MEIGVPVLVVQDEKPDKPAGIPRGRRFKSWLLHFRSSSLLMAWEKQRETQKKLLPLDQPNSGHFGYLGNEPVDGRSLSLSVKSAFQMKLIL